jgi:hypothetical protein
LAEEIVPSELSPKIVEQMRKAGLPSEGPYRFDPRLTTNRNGEAIMEKQRVQKGPKQGKRGYVDTQGRIWVKDWAHAGLPDHWDVQIQGGEDYIRVDLNGHLIS